MHTYPPLLTTPISMLLYLIRGTSVGRYPLLLCKRNEIRIESASTRFVIVLYPIELCWVLA
uniref:Uncharacterized protein n=1 Tax=Anopheles arabiensis TaxID=7173 RepID=A0A182IFT1_ANOAR